MKLDNNLLQKCYRDSMILQYERELESQGYSVMLGYVMNGLNLDLYAEKGSEKRAYEFKLVGNKNYINGNIKKFKEQIESLGILPFVVFVNPPVETHISFDNLDELLTAYLSKEPLPHELESISPGAEIDAVDINKLTSISVTDGITKIEGYATISINLQDSANRDAYPNGKYSEAFPMNFTVNLRNDETYSIEHIEYEIDTSSWIE